MMNRYSIPLVRLVASDDGETFTSETVRTVQVWAEDAFTAVTEATDLITEDEAPSVFATLVTEPDALTLDERIASIMEPQPVPADLVAATGPREARTAEQEREARREALAEARAEYVEAMLDDFTEDYC